MLGICTHVNKYLDLKYKYKYKYKYQVHISTWQACNSLLSFSADGNELATLSNERPQPIKSNTINAENIPGTPDQCRVIHRVKCCRYVKC